MASKRYIGDFLLGDLQETITTTSRDNQGGCKYERLEFGVFNALSLVKKNFTSLVFEYEGLESHITRESLSDSTGGRGLSHILASSKVEDLYGGGCVDKPVSSCSIHSYHHIVAADFTLAIPIMKMLFSKPSPVD